MDARLHQFQHSAATEVSRTQGIARQRDQGIKGSSDREERRAGAWISIAIGMMTTVVAGCASAPSTQAPRVSEALASRPNGSANEGTLSVRGRDGDAARKPSGGPSVAPVSGQPIASVDDRPLARADFLELLLRSHGPALLEQLIVLRVAEQIAAERGLEVTQADIDAEYDRGLRRLTDPLSAITGQAYDRLAAEEILARLLDDRQVSRGEYLLAIRRNAFLRRLALDELRINEADLRDEYNRVFGERVEVRHIQLSSPVEVERVREALRAGEDFGELARRLSLNSAGAMKQGLLEPFSRQDESVPEPFREAAFRVAPGEISPSFRIGSWYHLLRVERRIPAESPPWEIVRDSLERRLQERLVEPKLAQLHERLFREARVRIDDPVLREAFEKKYSRIGR